MFLIVYFGGILMNSLLSKIDFNTILADGAIGKGYDWGQASNVAVCGGAIVFLMLVLLVVCIAVFGKIMDGVNGTTKPKTLKPENKVKPVPTPVVNNAKVSSDTDEDVIAAIAAAVGYLYSGSDVKPVIRAIRPASSKTQRSAWANAGVIQNTRAF